MHTDLSVALAVFNEERNLSNCLDSVKHLTDDIVVVDGGSVDRTVNIAKSHGAKVKITDNPAIFHINKQKALDLCRHKWVLQLDADETVSPELALEIVSVIDKDKTDAYSGYFLPRKNIFWGKVMNKGGLYPDYVIRLIQKNKARFPCISVHEQIDVDGRVGYLKNPLIHYAYSDMKEYWRKADTYINLTVDQMKSKNIRPDISSFFYYMLFKPLDEFINRYIYHKGFLDGWQGFVFAFFSSLHYPKAYLRFSSR